VEALAATRKAVRGGRRTETAASLLVAIVERVIDAVDDYADRLAGTLDEIEEKIVAGEAGDERARLGEIRRNAVRLHRQLVMSRSLIKRFQSNLAGPSLPFELPRETRPASRLAG
jgi:zinc transporter